MLHQRLRLNLQIHIYEFAGMNSRSKVNLTTYQYFHNPYIMTYKDNNYGQLKKAKLNVQCMYKLVVQSSVKKIAQPVRQLLKASVNAKM